MELLSGKFSDNENNELLRLRKENSDLSAKILSLKKQIGISENLSEELESICNRNLSLEKENRDLNGKYDEIARRLKISLEKNSELQSQIEASQLEIRSKTSKELENMQNKVNSIEESNNELRKENSALNKAIQKHELEESECNNSIKSILQQASRYFSTKISSFSELQEKLSEIPPEEQPAPIQCDQSETDDEEKIALCRMIKRLKKQRKQLNKTLNDLQQQNQAEKQEISSKYESVINSLKSSLADEKRETSRQMQIVKELDERNNELIKKNSEQKAQTLKIQKGINDQNEEEISSLSAKVATLETQLKLEKEQSRNSKKELNSLISKYKSAQNSLRITKDELQETNRTSLEMKFNFDHLQTKYEDLMKQSRENETKRIETDKKITEYEERQKILDSKLSKSKEENEKNEKQIEEQETQIQNQNLQIQQLTQSLDEEKINFNTQKNLAENLKKKNEELNAELSKKDKEEREQQKQKEERNRNRCQCVFEEFPPSVWVINEMPQELAGMVTDIVNNRSLRNAAKVKNVLTIVIQWFSKENANAKRELESEKEKSKDADESLSALSGTLEAILGVDIDDGDLKNAVKVGQLQERLKQQLISSREEENERKQKENELMDLFTFLDVNSIQDVQNLFQELVQRLQESQGKVSELKKANKEVIKCANERDAECKKELDTLEKDALKIAEKGDALEKENAKLQNTIKELEENIVDLREEHSREMKTFNEMQNEQISECEKAVQKSHARVREEIQKRKELEEQQNCINSEKEKLQKSLQLIHLSKRKLEDDIQRLQAQIKSQSSVSQDKVRCVQESLQRKYETLIEQQKEQNEEISKLNKEKSKEIEQLENKIEELNESNAQLQLEIQKIEMKSQSALEEEERSKKILECKLKTDLMSLESEYNLKLDTAQRQIESERRAIMGRVGVEFCSLFNTSESLDENNFETFIRSLKEKFDLYAEEDTKIRALLNIPRDELISNVISSNFCSFNE